MDGLVFLANLMPKLARLDNEERIELLMWVNSRAAYRDECRPERKCDHCRRSYHGPAAFCSHRCAVAAA